MDDDEILANREKEESLNEDGVYAFDGEYEVGKAYTSKIDMYMADNFRDFIFSEDEENEARQLGMIQDDDSLVIPAGTEMIYVGRGGGGWPEFRVGKFLDFDIVDSNDDGYVLYPMDESLNEDARFYVDGDAVIDSLNDNSSIGTMYDDGTIDLFDAESVSDDDRDEIRRDLSDHYLVSFLDESVNCDDNLVEDTET